MAGVLPVERGSKPLPPLFALVVQHVAAKRGAQDKRDGGDSPQREGQQGGDFQLPGRRLQPGAKSLGTPHELTHGQS